MTEWTLPGALDSVSAARRLVADAAGEHPRIDDAVLATSELVTNAIRHGTGSVHLAVHHIDGALRVSVRSASTGLPAVHVADPSDSGGRGLAIVAALATSWGWERDGDLVHVWADFAQE